MNHEIIVSGTVAESSHYVVVKAERNLGQGIAMMFGGAIAVAALEGANSGSSGSWSYTIVEQKSFEQECAK
jgi:hypothetical protein